jgi:crooked neck
MIKVIPHSHFTFAKVWNLHANFLIRYGDLNLARKTLGLAIGTCEKEKIYKNYIDLELSLREFDRVRTLYEKYLAWMPSNCQAWIRFAELERSLGDIDRARAIFDIAAEQSELDMPEVLWKSYIDFEAEEQEWDKARQLYHRLLKRTRHIKVLFN